MAEAKPPKSSREKVRAYRERLRRQGLRPLALVLVLAAVAACTIPALWAARVDPMLSLKA